MRIGILECDRMDTDIINTYGSYADMFKALLLPIDSNLLFNAYQSIDGQYPDDIDECDAYLVTGSKYSVYDNETWIQGLESYIRLLHEQRKKLIGICFGHQLIAQALGTKVAKSDKGWGVGNRKAEVIHRQSWMIPGTDNQHFTILYSHQDQVTALPEDATLIAGNDFCPIAGFQIQSHILTFQGHPEFTPEYAQNRLDFRRAKMGETTYQAAIESLQQKNDASLVASWMVNFLSSMS